MDLEPGTVVDERYSIDAQIGEGGMAVVYSAHHTKLHTKHAVKVLTLASRQIRERMLQEGRVQASLRHPNIVSVTDVITIGKSPALVMELIEGPPLDDLIVQQKLTIDQADTIGRGILAAVAYAHDKGLVHRDLKPANVMLEIEGNVVTPKVTDFGLAKVLHGDDEGRAATRTGSTMGTPQYMSPEQIEDTKNVDERSDVFALGAILYELVTGQRAFEGDNIMQIFTKVSQCEYTPVRELRPDAPDRMVEAIERSLVASREERVATVHQLFELFTAGEPLPATSFSSTAVSAMRTSSPSVETLAAPATTSHSATSIVQSPVVIGGGLFAIGGVALALVGVLALGAVGAFIYLQPGEEDGDGDGVAVVTPPEPGEAPSPGPVASGPDGTVAPAPAAVQPTPVPGGSPDPVQPAPEPQDDPGPGVPTDDASADDPEDEDPGDEDPSAGDPVEPEPTEDPGVEAPAPDAPVTPDPPPAPDPEPAQPADPAKMTIENVPMGMRSDSTSADTAIWNYRDERKAQVDQWLVVIMKERSLRSASRDKAVDTLAYRWSKGIGSGAIQQSAMTWAASYGMTSQQKTALDAIEKRGTNLVGPLAALKDSNGGVQSKAIGALVAVARRTGKAAEAKAALEAYLKTSPGSRNERAAQNAIGGL